MLTDNFFSKPDNKDFQITSEGYLSNNAVEWLSEIFSHTDWRCVTKDDDIDNDYNGIPVTNIFKALVLPYLINIPYERYLWSVLLKNKSLQSLCGVICQEPKQLIEKSSNASISSLTKKNNLLIEKKIQRSILQKRSFWHFRNKYKGVFANKIIKILISIVLDDLHPNFSLPFVQPTTFFDESPERIIAEWKPEGYRPSVLISIPHDLDDPDYLQEEQKQKQWESDWQEKLRSCNDLIVYRELVNQREKEKLKFRRNKIGFIKQINYPIYVKTNLPNGEECIFELHAPKWHEEAFYRIKPRFRNTDYGEKVNRVNYDKACNIIVMRNSGGKEEILLSQRKKDKIGIEKYAIPGGKQKFGESLEDCAHRELKEETNLRIISSRPVSLYYTRKKFTGEKQIMSVGVLVDQWEGELITMEPESHVGWKWYPIDNLPSPLFEFTQIALDQYRNKKYPNLSWDDVEEKPDTQLQIFKDQ